MDALKKFTRFDTLGIALILISAIGAAFGLSQFKSNTEDFVQWLPDDSPARVEYDKFEQKFGSDDFLVVTWPGCTINDPRLRDFSARLAATDSNGLIQSIISGPVVLDKLRAETDLSTLNILNRFKGILFGLQDVTQTLALIELSNQGSADRRQTLEQVELAIVATADLELDQAIMGGYPFVGINIDNQLRDSFLAYLLPSILLATFASLFCLRDVFLSSIVFFAAIGAAICSVAIVPILGENFTALMSIIPPLVYILTTSGSIHLIHYSLEAIGDPKRLVSIGWKPCGISALTTAIGMLSLLRSSFPAIRSFGLFCAIGVGFALLFQLIIVPWLLHRFGTAGQTKLAQRSTPDKFLRVATQVRRGRIAIAIAGIAVMLFSAYGLTKLTASVEVEKLFHPKSEIISSLTNLEERMGPIDQAEFLVEFDDVEAANFHVRSNLVYKIQRSLSALEEIGPTQSLHNYLPRVPAAGRLRSTLKRKSYQQKLDQQRDELADSRFLDVSGKAETWRISMRFPFTQETDFERQEELVLDAAVAAIDAAMNQEEYSTMTTRIHLQYTGKNHLFHSAQTSLLKDFYRNFLLAFVIITPVLIVVLRSFYLGLLAMLPNLFPILVLFGGLGWLGWPVDLSIAMTASVALGIAVDDTTHFLIRFREFGGSAANVLSPIRKAISQCGPAMLQTTAIGSAGLLVYCFTEMVVVRNFSLAITCMLVLALLADILFLPALLLLFSKEKTDQQADD